MPTDTYDLGPGILVAADGQETRTVGGSFEIRWPRDAYDGPLGYNPYYHPYYHPYQPEIRGVIESLRRPPEGPHYPPGAIGTLATDLAVTFSAYLLHAPQSVTFPSAVITRWDFDVRLGRYRCEFTAFPQHVDGEIRLFRVDNCARGERQYLEVFCRIDQRLLEMANSEYAATRVVHEHLLRAGFDMRQPINSYRDPENRSTRYWQHQWTPPEPEPVEIDLAALKEQLVKELFAGPNDGPLHIARIDGEGGFRMVPSEN